MPGWYDLPLSLLLPLLPPHPVTEMTLSLDPVLSQALLSCACPAQQAVSCMSSTAANQA